MHGYFPPSGLQYCTKSFLLFKQLFYVCLSSYSSIFKPAATITFFYGPVPILNI